MIIKDNTVIKKLFNLINNGNYFLLKKEILRSGLNLNIKGRYGDNIMHLLVMCDNINLFEMLRRDFREINDIVDIQNYEGKTPLMLACEYGHLRFIKYLFLHSKSTHYYTNFDININKRDLKGMTAVLIAYKNRFYEMVKYLVSECKADYTLNSYDGYNIPINFVNNILKNEKPTVYIPLHILNEYINMLVELKKTCPVCFDEYKNNKIVKTECNHFFCEECYEKIKNQKCPTCRAIF